MWSIGTYGFGKCCIKLFNLFFSFLFNTQNSWLLIFRSHAQGKMGKPLDWSRPIHVSSVGKKVTLLENAQVLRRLFLALWMIEGSILYALFFCVFKLFWSLLFIALDFCHFWWHLKWALYLPLQMGKRNREPSTPTLRFHREQKHNKAVKSAPHDLGQARKKKKTQYEGSDIKTPNKSKHRGGWIMDDPGDFAYDNGRKHGWRSPKTPSSRGHYISYLNGGGHMSTSQSKRSRNFYETPNFQRPSHGFQYDHYGTRFGNSSSGGNRRNYDWW